MAWNLLERDERPSRSVYINFTAIGIFVLLAAGLASGVHIWHMRQVARHTPLVLEEAQKRAAVGEYVSALAYYKTYLGYRPTDVDAVTEHALLTAKIAQGADSAADAYFALLNALAKAPQRDDVRRELVTFAVRLGRIRDCKEELDTLLDEAPDDLDVLELAARGAVQLRQFDTARVRYEKLLERKTDRPETYLELIRLLSVEIKDQDHDVAADAVLARLLQRHPASSDIRTMASAYYLRRGQLAQAEEQAAVALDELQATDPALYQLQAEIARQRRRPLEYQARLSQLAEKTDKDLRLEFQLAEVELSLGRLHPARERLLQIARHDQATAEQVWQAITLLAAAHLTEDEAELRERLKTLDTAEVYVSSLTMQDRMRQQDWAGALELARGLLKRPDSSPRMIITLSMWRAECYAQLGDVAEQINCYRRAIGADGNHQPARSRLAQLLFRTGNIQEAQGEYAMLIQQSPSFAREFVTELVQAQSPEAQSPLSSAEVDRLFSRWRDSAPYDAMPALCQLDLLQRKGESERVSQLTAEGLQKWPQEVGFRLAQVDRLLQARDWDSAWSALDDAETQCGLQPTLLVRRIVCLEGFSPEDQAARLIACTEQFATFDRDGQAQVWPILIRGLQRSGVDPQSVESILNEFGEKNPGDALARLVLLQRAVSTDDMDTARRHLESLRSALGDESPSYRLASILCDVKSAKSGDAAALSRAMASLESLRAAWPKAPPQLLLLAADLDLLQKRPQDALTHLQEAVRAGDSRAATLTRTVALMVMSGQLDQTVPYLKSLEAGTAAETPSTSDEPKPVAGLLPKRRDLPSLRTVLESAVADSWPVALAAFRVDLERNQPERAAEAIQHALKSAPQNPLVWANWLAYLERHQPDRLDQALTDVQQQLSLVEQARLLPAILLRRKRLEAAQTLLKSASQAAPQDPAIFRSRVRLLRQKPGKENIETLLQDTLATQDAALAPVREAARRELARLKSVAKDYRTYREAVALAAEIIAQAAPEDEDAWMIQGEICSAHAGHWKDALAAFKKLEASPRREVRAEAFFQEAGIHEQRRRWDEQAVALASLRQLTPQQPQLIAQLLWNAVRRKDKAAAEQFHKELSTLTTEDRPLLLSDVLLSTLSEDHADIVPKVLTAFEDERITRDAAVEWLTLLKADEACDALLKQALDVKQPATVAKYALFLASRHKASAAMPYLSQLWESGPYDTAAAVAASMSASPLVTPADLDGIRTPLSKLAERENTGLPLLAAAAALEDHAGHHAEAMALYRRMLAQAPDNVVALNNLAFLEAVAGAETADSALERILHAWELFGPNDQLLDTTGVVLLRRGDAQAALERFQQAFEQRPETTYQVHRAWALTELGQFKAAAEAFQQVDAADPPARLHPLERPLDVAWRKQLLDHQ